MLSCIVETREGFGQAYSKKPSTMRSQARELYFIMSYVIRLAGSRPSDSNGRFVGKKSNWFFPGPSSRLSDSKDFRLFDSFRTNHLTSVLNWGKESGRL